MLNNKPCDFSDALKMKKKKTHHTSKDLPCGVQDFNFQFHLAFDLSFKLGKK